MFAVFKGELESLGVSKKTSGRCYTIFYHVSETWLRLCLIIDTVPFWLRKVSLYSEKQIQQCIMGSGITKAPLSSWRDIRGEASYIITHKTGKDFQRGG